MQCKHMLVYQRRIYMRHQVFLGSDLLSIEVHNYALVGTTELGYFMRTIDLDLMRTLFITSYFSHSLPSVNVK